MAYQDVKTIEYTVISKDRIQYLQEIVSLCQRHNINYTFFITPLNGQLLSKIEQDVTFYKTLKKFKIELANITDYYDFLTHNIISDNRFFFGGDVMHTTPFTGNIILARLFSDANISLPEKFGVFVPKREVQP